MTKKKPKKPEPKKPAKAWAGRWKKVKGTARRIVRLVKRRPRGNIAEWDPNRGFTELDRLPGVRRLSAAEWEDERARHARINAEGDRLRGALWSAILDMHGEGDLDGPDVFVPEDWLASPRERLGR